MNFILKFCLLLAVFSLVISCGTKENNDLTIQEIPFKSESSAILPHLVSSHGQLYISWVDTLSTKGSQLIYAKLDGNSWSWEIVLASGENWFVNWADYPMIAVNKEKILSHYLQNSSSSGMAYDIFYNQTILQEAKESKHHLLNNDSTHTEHGFVSMLPNSDSTFLIAWLDGRNMQNHDHDSGHSHEHHSGEMSVRVAEVDSEGKLRNESVVDSMACTCCQTTSSMTSNGPVLLYRDCSENNIRDISIVRQVNGSWTKPVSIHPDNWFIEGCPVNGPKSDAIGNSLAVAWFTGANNKAKIQVLFSENSGESFSKPILISESEVLGRVDIVMIKEGEAVVSWMESKGNETYLFAAKVDEKLGTGKPYKVSKLSSSRKTGFPQMEILNNKIYFAWMDVSEKGTLLKTSFLPVELLSNNLE